MAIFSIIMNLFRLSYDKLSSFAQVIHKGLSDHAADYPTPTVTLADFQTDIDALKAAITAWGVKGDRGSHTDHLNLVIAAAMVREDLRLLADYAKTAQPNNPSSWSEVGFPLKSPKTAPQPLAAVRNFHRFISRKVADGSIKLSWKRPEDTANGDVKCYVLQFSNDGVRPPIDGSRGVVNVLTVVTDTSVIITPPYVGANYFWVTPVNGVGFGATSEPVYYNAPGKAL